MILLDLPAWFTALLVIGAIILCLTILYAVIAYGYTEKTIYITATAPAQSENDIAGYYYLPAPLIKIIATAKVEIQNDDAGNFKDARLKELSLVATTETFPDTSQLLLLQYTSSSFANDDVKITVNNMGLLDNVSSVTEDRFSHIISALFEAPGNILKRDGVAALAAEAAATTEIKEFTREFILTPDKIKIGTSNSFLWMIDVPDSSNSQKQIDASFKVTFDSPFNAPAATQTNTISYTGNGILVRPPVALRISFSPDNKNPLKTLLSNASTISVPDVSKAILIPVSRSSFVKKTQGLKFQNGMLIENSIVKPSESEAFISIPINILKAIFSIPSHLLSFRIHHIQQQKSLVTEDAALAKARLDSETARIGADAELSKAKLDAQKAMTSFEQELLKAKLETQKAVTDAEKAKITSETELIKAKLDTQKTATDAEKARITSETELIKAKLDSEKNRQNFEVELAKDKLEGQKNLFTEQTNLLKAWQVLLEEMKKK